MVAPTRMGRPNRDVHLGSDCDDNEECIRWLFLFKMRSMIPDLAS